MPNFMTHWLVANECIGKWTGEIPPYIKSGREAYTKAVDTMSDDLITALQNIKTKDDLKKFKKREKDERDIVSGSFQHIIRTFDNALKGIKEVSGKEVQDNAKHDDITCFSAYMLGACGPDFWMMPSHGGGRAPLNMGAHHFDLGHYNRTHRVFNAISESRRTLRWQRRRHPRRICNTPRRLLLAAWISSLIEKWRMKGCVGLSVNSAGLERSYA